jgi:hypothetical protein
MRADHIVRRLLEDDGVDPKAFIKAHGKQLDGPSREHLMVSSTDGGLYDTRKPNWHMGPPIRQNYQQFFPRINNVAEFKATWRARGNSNYHLAFILSDGEAICEKCVADNIRRIIDSTRTQSNDGWRVVGVASCHGGDENEDGAQCVQCNKNLGELD